MRFSELHPNRLRRAPLLPFVSRSGHRNGGAVELIRVTLVDERQEITMAPDRGSTQDGIDSNDRLRTEASSAEADSESESDGAKSIATQEYEPQERLLEKSEMGQNFTIRGVAVGLVIGIVICFSNTYFGLQTGWVSGMTMPAALIGFGFFKTVSRCISYPFSPVENVLVQTVAGAIGTMPLGCGFVGVMPALNFLLKSEENGPISPKLGQMIVWAIGICFFGVVLAVPLRKEVIIRERLKFPSGTATALMIGVVHGNTDKEGKLDPNSGLEIYRQRSLDVKRSTSIDGQTLLSRINTETSAREPGRQLPDDEADHRDDWKAKIRLLIYAFCVSAIYVG